MLRWSINLFRVFGIQLAVHVSFLLLLAYYAWRGWLIDGPGGMAWSTVLIVLFFGCVILHELGHSLTARRYGVQVPRILLLPIGGMAEFDRIPRKPSAELLITLAGPAVNYLLVLLILPFCWRHLLGVVETPDYSAADLLLQLWWANLIMGTFNLLPVFPMDGGRIFRAVLAYRLPYLRATWWAATVGRVLALLFAGVAAFYYDNTMAAVLFVFIFMAAGAEYQTVLRREQETAYWAEVARRVAASPTAEEDPPPPPFLGHGPN
jgi:Zn-dependent protease